jgi:hypothetical protein
MLAKEKTIPRMTFPRINFSSSGKIKNTKRSDGLQRQQQTPTYFFAGIFTRSRDPQSGAASIKLKLVIHLVIENV